MNSNLYAPTLTVTEADRPTPTGQPPSVLLTGGRGRIAEAILAECRQAWRIISYSRKAGDGHADLGELLERGSPLHAEAIIHCAWSTVPATAEQDPAAAARTDLGLVEKIVRRLQGERKPPLIVFMSTGAVYGPAPGRASREEDPTHPIGAYAKMKLAAEDLFKASGLPVCILRVGNVYSLPSNPQDAQGVVARLVRCALTGSTFNRWGDDSIKDYLHRSDFLDALQRVIALKLEGTWNVGSGLATSLASLVAQVERSAGSPVTVLSSPAPPWDVGDNRLNVTRFSQAACWMPRISLEEGIRREVERLQPSLSQQRADS